MELQALLEAGLTTREADAYLALLKLEEATVAEIARATRENRTHLYDTLASLLRKGLVSSVVKNGRKYFRAAPPEELVDYMEERTEHVVECLPALRALCRTRTRPMSVEVFEGLEGIKTVLRDVLKEHKPIWCLGTTGRSARLIPYFIEHFHQRRVKQRQLMRAIYNDDALGSARAQEVVRQQKYVDIRCMPKTSPTTTYIYGNKVVIIVWEKEKLVAVMMQDSDIADAHRSYFESVWKQARRV